MILKKKDKREEKSEKNNQWILSVGEESCI